MKKLIACVLALCLVVSAMIGGAAFVSPSADAETVTETTAQTQPVEAVATAEPTAAPQQTKTTEPTDAAKPAATAQPAQTEGGDAAGGAADEADKSNVKGTGEGAAEGAAEGGAEGAEGESGAADPSDTEAGTDASDPSGDETATEPTDETAQGGEASDDDGANQKGGEAGDAKTVPAGEDKKSEPADDAPTADYGSGPAYVMDRGYRHYGELTELVECDQTIYLYQRLVLEIEGYTIEELGGVAFALDPDAFTGDDNVIYLSKRDPNGNVKDGTVFVWPGKKAQTTDNAERLAEVIDADDEDIMEYEIQVQAADYLAGEPCAPAFTLVSFPSAEAGMSFAVGVDGAEPESIDGDAYAPGASGEYRFYLLGENGAQLARSAKYTVIYGHKTEGGEEGKAEEVADELTDDPAIDPSQMTAGEATDGDANGDADGDTVNQGAIEPTDKPAIDPDQTTAGESTDGNADGDTLTPSADDAPVTDEVLELDGIALTALSLALAPSAELELTVTTVGYEGSAPSAATPIFNLSGLPEDGEYAYAYRMDDGAWTQMIGDSYTATQLGAYTLSFAILDAADEPVTTPASYALNLISAPTAAAGAGGAQQAWTLVDGSRVDGALSDLLQTAGSPIYLLTDSTLVLSEGYAALAGKRLLPDPTLYSGKIVKISDTKPDVESDSGVLVWLADPGAASAATSALTVAATHLVENAWSHQAPTFALSSDPDISTLSGLSYAMLLDDGTPILLSGATYTALDEGEYALRFAIVDESGAIVSQSGAYSLMLDYTAPLLNVSTADKFMMKVIAGDAVSGGQYVSIDGGKRWSKLTAYSTGVSYRQYSAAQAMTFAPGMIVVKDRAGNTTANTEAVTLYSTAANNPSGAQGGTANASPAKSTGTGTGAAGTSRTVSHAKNTVTDVVAYNGVELITDDGSMTQLVVGDEALDLELYRDSFLVTEDEALEPATPTPPTFTAAFTASSGDETDGVDTLVLTASDDTLDLAATYTYTWEFSGVVYKKLAASGIDYLVLRIGENVTILSTAGFSAGIRYNMYRAEGMTSKEFRYTVRMGMPGPTFEMDVTVGGQTYAMTADESAEFYYYDVYTGTTEQLVEQGAIRLDSLEG